MESNKCLVLIASKQKNILVVCNENLKCSNVHGSTFHLNVTLFSNERVKLISFRLKRSNTISFK